MGTSGYLVLHLSVDFCVSTVSLLATVFACSGKKVDLELY